MKKLIILMHSMRSHETGEYQIMLDSNVNIILHQLSILPEDHHVTVTTPYNHNVEYMTQCLEISDKFKCKVTWLFIPYGDNAGHSRDIMNDQLGSINFDDFNEVDSHFCTVEPRKSPMSWVYFIFNSAVMDQVRPYAEKHFMTMLRNLEKEYHTVLSCKNQQAILPPILEHYTSIENKFFNPRLAEHMMKKYYNPKLAIELDESLEMGSLFFPFRVSDSCYRADIIDKMCLPIVITDPNDSASKVFSGPILNIDKFHPCKKTLYMTMLKLMKIRKDITIPLYEDITKNYHISIVEMLYFCPDNIDFLYGEVNIHDLKDRYILK